MVVNGRARGEERSALAVQSAQYKCPSAITTNAKQKRDVISQRRQNEKKAALCLRDYKFHHHSDIDRGYPEDELRNTPSPPFLCLNMLPFTHLPSRTHKNNAPIECSALRKRRLILAPQTTDLRIRPQSPSCGPADRALSLRGPKNPSHLARLPVTSLDQCFRRTDDQHKYTPISRARDPQYISDIHFLRCTANSTRINGGDRFYGLANKSFTAA